MALALRRPHPRPSSPGPAVHGDHRGLGGDGQKRCGNVIGARSRIAAALGQHSTRARVRQHGSPAHQLSPFMSRRHTLSPARTHHPWPYPNLRLTAPIAGCTVWADWSDPPRHRGHHRGMGTFNRPRADPGEGASVDLARRWRRAPVGPLRDDELIRTSLFSLGAPSAPFPGVPRATVRTRHADDARAGTGDGGRSLEETQQQGGPP